MTHVWLLSQADYEDAQVLGVYTTQTQAEAAREALWTQYQQLTEEQRMLVGPMALRLLDTVTHEAFDEWHFITEAVVDAVPDTYQWKEPGT